MKSQPERHGLLGLPPNILRRPAASAASFLDDPQAVAPAWWAIMDHGSWMMWPSSSIQKKLNPPIRKQKGIKKDILSNSGWWYKLYTFVYMIIQCIFDLFVDCWRWRVYQPTCRLPANRHACSIAGTGETWQKDRWSYGLGGFNLPRRGETRQHWPWNIHRFHRYMMIYGLGGFNLHLWKIWVERQLRWFVKFPTEWKSEKTTRSKPRRCTGDDVWCFVMLDLIVSSWEFVLRGVMGVFFLRGVMGVFLAGRTVLSN